MTDRAHSHRKPRLANSFTRAEVRAMLDLHACVLRGGDARHIARAGAVLAVVRKFADMHRKYEAAIAAGIPITDAPSEVV
jgi:hypothetical protein